VRHLCTLAIACCFTFLGAAQASEVDRILAKENKANGVEHEPLPLVDDMAFLRRATVDLIGRIPTNKEINTFLAWPEAERRTRLIETLLDHDRYTDRWTTFFADMFRIRSNASGGTRLQAYVHQAIESNMPYDKLCRSLIQANGRASTTPEVGFILGDNAEPLAMAAVTSQVFMGIRMGCAECHDHPFDVWTRKDFYGLAAFFGKTKLIENDFTNSVYTTEVDEMVIKWPPPGVGDDSERKPMKPRFPIQFEEDSQPSQYVARLNELRNAEQQRLAAKRAQQKKAKQIESILDANGDLDADELLSAVNVGLEAKRDIRNIDIQADLYRRSQLRAELAAFVTSPRNRYFGRAIVNRLWAELVGRGFVEPVDDFRDDNRPRHAETIDYLVNQFVASGYDLKNLVRMITTSDAYQRAHAVDVKDKVREELESNFLATPMRRMLSEALYDSIITAGHLFDIKHPAGVNNKTIQVETRVAVKVDPDSASPGQLASITPEQATQQAMAAMPARQEPVSGYDLEKAIEVDFDAVLDKKSGAPQVDRMKVVTQEELEAQAMMKEKKPGTPGVKYVTKMVEKVVDDNPQYGSSMRMATPAPDGHFLRVFGQPARADLGDLRDPSPSMRQALMILNGKLTHEASRVGQLEVMYRLLAGDKANLENAIRLAYREILTREPTETDYSEAKQIVSAAGDPLEGMADLRWVLLNCHEFRFVP